MAGCPIWQNFFSTWLNRGLTLLALGLLFLLLRALGLYLFWNVALLPCPPIRSAMVERVDSDTKPTLPPGRPTMTP